MSTQDDQAYLDSMAIVEAYERAARSEQTRVSALINMDATVAVLSSILDAAETALDQMDQAEAETPSDTMAIGGEGSNQDINLSEGQEAENSCAPEEEEGWTAKYKGGTTFEVGLTKDLSVDDPIKAMLEALNVDMTEDEIRDDLERCFDCDLRPKFNFQIKPINFLSELLPLIEGIHDLVDQVLDAMEPLDILKWLCDIGDLFKDGWCIPDLVALLLGWQNLLQKYFGQMLRIALDWTFIIGPLIKFIVDMVAALLEQIRRIIIAPLDCIAKVLGQLVMLEDAIIDTIDDTAAFVQTFPDFWDQKFGGTSTTTYQGVKKAENSASFRRVNSRDSTKVGMPTGLTFSVDDTLEQMFDKNVQGRRLQRIEKKKAKYREKNPLRMTQLSIENPGMTSEELAQELEKEMTNFATKPSLLKSLLGGTNSTIAAINQFFANVLLAVKSLNAFVVGTLGLSIKLSGLILMVLDLIKFIVFIINTLKSGLSLSDLCAKLKNDPEYAKELMNSWFFHEEGDNISKDREEWQKIMEEFQKPPEEDCTPEA